LDQTKYTIETRVHEFMDSKVVGLLLKFCAFCEERHAIKDCPFVPFHFGACIAKHVEL
jgi:hypothetical protein